MFEGASDTSGTYDNVETHVDIIRALERMPKESANLLWQINYEGRSQREVAKELGITESAVSHRLTRSDSCV
jgi:DNA-directed RNA polymerase specialized sigma24 family protein